jgi:glycosyltransferase involved in cell wall biosynthesis
MDTLLAQDYGNIELIVSDNGSTDGTWGIVTEYAARDQRVIPVRQERNEGAAFNFLFVLNKARGNYFMWGACDDWWHPAFVSTLKAALDAHPAHGVCMSSFVRVRDNGAVVDEIILTGIHDLTPLPFGTVFRRMTKTAPGGPIHLFIYGLFRRALLRKILTRSFPDCIAADRVVMSEMALVTRFSCVAPILHWKTVRHVPLDERYSEETLGQVWRDKHRVSRYLWAMLVRLITSPWIPLGRRLRHVPAVWLRLAWVRRHIVLKELLPRGLRDTGLARTQRNPR